MSTRAVEPLTEEIVRALDKYVKRHLPPMPNVAMRLSVKNHHIRELFPEDYTTMQMAYCLGKYIRERARSLDVVCTYHPHSGWRITRAQQTMDLYTEEEMVTC